MTNPNNQLMVEGMHPDVANHKPSHAIASSVAPLVNLLEEYVFKNSYHSNFHGLLTTYCPLDYQFEYEVCPDIITNIEDFIISHPETYARLQRIHKAGRAATMIYVMDKLLQSHPDFYLQWSESGLSMSDFAKQYAKE